MGMIKITLLAFIISGCVKSPCIYSVDFQYKCENLELLQSVEIHFQQGERIVLADIVHSWDFENAVYKWVYEFPDTNPDLLVWKVYATDKSFVEYRTWIK